MKKFLSVLSKSALFDKLDQQQIYSVLQCLSAEVKQFDKNAVVFHDGDIAQKIGIILSGEIATQKLDYNGNVNIISKLYPTDIIAASACYSSERVFPFDAVCVSTCQVLLLDSAKLVRCCDNTCGHHSQLTYNMLSIVAQRNIRLAEKIDILTKRTLREKVLAYLFTQSQRAKSTRFSVPLSRRQMAEYLSANRSALSRELGQLQQEGIIEFDGKRFELKKHQD